MARNAIARRRLGLFQRLMPLLALGDVAQRLPRARTGGIPRIELDAEAEAYRRMAFTFTVIALAARLAKCDGGLTREEFIAFREAFPLDDRESAKIRALFQHAWQEEADVAVLARQVAYLYPDRPALRRELLKHLACVALADGPLKPEELRLLTAIGQVWGFTRPQLVRLIASCRDRKPDPFRVLGLPRRTRMPEVKTRYHALMRRYHPDALAATVNYPEALAVAQRKSAAISSAYKAIWRA